MIYAPINVQKSLPFDAIYLLTMTSSKHSPWNLGKRKKRYTGVSGYFWVVSTAHEHKGQRLSQQKQNTTSNYINQTNKPKIKMHCMHVIYNESH